LKTYGTISLSKDRKTWLLDAAPHVVLRLKRLFPSTSRKTSGALRVSNTRDTCVDLAWVLARWPLAFKHARDREELERVAEEHSRATDLLEDLFKGARPPRAFELAVPAREYQRIAADAWLTTRGLLLADDVGLGKTCSAIAALTDPATRPALVVTLAHLPRQWEAEIRRFAPSLTTHVLRKGTPYDLRAGSRRKRAGQALLPGLSEYPDVIISTYHKLAGWEEAFAGKVRSVIFDECQELRGGPGKKGKPIKKNVAAAGIAEAATFRIGLSATPIYNYGGEFFNVLGVLRPHELGTRTEFSCQWCKGGYDDKAKIADPAAFGAWLRDQGIMLRRTREDVGRELPELVKIPHHIDCDRAPLDDVQDSALQLARFIVERGGGAERTRGDVMQASEELSNLVRQATGIAKAPHVADFVRMLVENGEPVVLYGWHRSVYDIWTSRLRDLQPAMYTGSESATQKQAAKDAFVSGATDVLIMSLRSGAGLDGLQHRGRTVVFGELDWSPGVHEQAAGRVHRDGQAASVVAYFLISDSGSDPIVADVLGVKRAQIAGVRDPAGGLVERLETGENRIRRLAEAYLEPRAQQ
jgi:SNF2 family DNA or RNA helicase